MSKNKIVIIVLVLLLIIYLSGTATGFVPKFCNGMPMDVCKQAYINKMKHSGSGGWEKTLGKIMNKFAPRLPVKQLLGNRSNNNCKVVNFRGSTAIQLDMSFRQCNIRVNPFTGDKLRVGRFRIAENRGSVRVTYKPNDKDETGDNYIKPNEPLDISVMPAGGNINLSCGTCATGTLHVTIE